ncbi:DUF4175 family protein [Sunxiuqinia sp. sy24]|uniref:DUF4175 family protein n=1 Tax=Sunxiuqinia sp. sy24 TaxID=3461495 RepID=UPI0040465516
MTDRYKQLVDNLDLYTRKRNIFELIRGFILSTLLLLSYLVAVLLIEHYSYLTSFARTLLFYFSALLFAGIVIFYFVTPLLKLIGVIKPMTYEKVSEIVSEHFEEIDDQLINIIELAGIGQKSKQSLIWASVDEKIEKLKSYDFSKAVSYKKLRTSFGVLLLVICFSFLLSMAFPGVFSESGKRLVAYDESFQKPAPFTFEILNDSLKVKKGNGLKLQAKCKGSDIPEVLYINIAGSDYLMTKEDTIFSYSLEHIMNSFTVYFTNLTYESEKFQIDVLPAPAILEYTVQITPPTYTGFDASKESMMGDLEVPFGSEIKWVFKTLDTDSLHFIVDGEKAEVVQGQNGFAVEFLAKKDFDYSISIKNSYFDYPNLLNFQVDIIPDLYPQIKVAQLRDSVDYTRFYFKGSIADDYGFHSLNYHVVIQQKDSVIVLPILKQLSQQDFYFTYDFKELLGLTDQVDYYFSVRDNDYFHSYKEAVSETFQFMFPSKEELDHLDDQNFLDLEQLMEESFKLSDDIQQAIDELKFKSMSENSSNWEKQQLVSEIMNKKNKLENILDQVQQKNAEMNDMKNSFSEEKAEMVKKQKQIEELLEDVFDEELKKLFEEFNELAKEFDQAKFDELSNRSEMSMDDLSKQLERNLQMLKRMKLEQELEEVIEALDELSRDEENIAQNLDESRNFEETELLEQENKRKLDELQENLNKAFDMNKTLDKPMNLHPMDKEFEQINSVYDEVGELLENRRKNKSVEKIERNSDNYENASFMLNQMLVVNEHQQSLENIRDLQQILDNLVYLSLQQEILYDEVRLISESDPRLNLLRIEQDHLIGQSQVMKDSLYAVAKRTPEIGNVVTKELVNLEFAMDKALTELEENRLNMAISHQQRAITAANNMALFLNEALDNLQKQMANAMPGDQQCDKPGSNPGSNMNLLKQAQQGMKEQLQQMIEQMKSGETGYSSEQIGKTLAQQEMMQQMVRELLMNSEVGSSAKEQLKQINQLLEQNTVDLARKNLTSVMISRQNLILNKLLKAEKAEMERDVDDQRESKTAEDNFYSNPIDFFEYKKQEKELEEVIERNNYQLRNFYDRKYKEYINNLRKEN